MPGLTVGDLAPWFTPAITASEAQRLGQSSAQDFIMGGYRAVLFFFGSSRNPQVQAALSQFAAAKPQFEQLGIHFFGISIDPHDQALEQTIEQSSHFHWLWDFTGDISIQYGVCQLDKAGQVAYDPTTFVLDENLRILNLFPLETHISHAAQVLNYLVTLPAVTPPRLIRQQAPVLLVPNVLPAEFCQQLIQRYQTDGGTESGFMRQEGEKTVVVVDPKIKRRRDWLVSDPALVTQINDLLGRRVIPEIQKAFQFRVTCFERYVVACYEATNQGFFQPHRDNTAIGTAHRRFAMTLNLNSGYEGGMLRFPEYGSDLYAPEPGSALLFSCSLLHEATPVTQGQRFVLLSFLYGDEDAKLRQQTQKQIVRSGAATANLGNGLGNERIQPSSKSGSGFQTRSKR